ncbi:MAG: DUF4105 domain-containing protein [Prevotellaceae bacterium]|nr:DUF4105 domain-containing protein [Prevotellaceae bacterium]
MRFFQRYILACSVLLAVALRVAAQNAEGVSANADSVAVDSVGADGQRIRVAVLTCTAGDELYSKFGHTALLVQRNGEEDGRVYNYGCFDYNADSFVMNFVLGHTDYILGAESYSLFIYRYGYMGVGVDEQELNLTNEEAERLVTLLEKNLLPENQVYRYNWLYNNCTEKARDIVEMAVDGKVAYEREETDITVREMLRGCLEDVPWESFGIDMILGEEIDRPTDKRVRMFLPAFYMDEVEKAVKVKEGAPLVKGKQQIIQAQNIVEKPSFWLSPTFVFIVLFVVVCLVSAAEHRMWHNWVGIDVFLHTVQGIAGVLVAFLFFFSEHPAVDSNWLVIIFNPIPLLYAVWLSYCKRKRRTNVLAYINLGVLVGFLVTMFVCRQSFNMAMYFIVLSLLTRAVAQSYNAYRRIK